MEPLELIRESFDGKDFCQVFVVNLDSLIPTEHRFAVVKVCECNRQFFEDAEMCESLTQATIAAYEFYSKWLEMMDRPTVDPTVDPTAENN